MKRSCVWLAVLALVAGAGVCDAGSPKGKAFKISDQEKTLLELTNLERKKQNLPPLRPNAKLFQSARSHSVNMAKQGKMEHVLDGKTPFDRLRKVGYRFQTGGENIAFSNEGASLPTIMREWMKSKSHRENILLADFTEVGLGLARDARGDIYYTQVFARPLPDDE